MEVNYSGIYILQPCASGTRAEHARPAPSEVTGRHHSSNFSGIKLSGIRIVFLLPPFAPVSRSWLSLAT